MFNVTTKYVQINNERKKAFMIKGGEAYVKPTDTELTIDQSTITSTETKGFKIPSLTVNVYRNVGSSVVYLYDGEEIIANSIISDGEHSIIFSNIYLAYNVTHELFAVFVGNDSCYSSKSKKTTLNIGLPSTLKTTIEFINPTTQIREDEVLTLNMTAKTNNVNVANNTPINLYIDDILVTTVIISNGSANATLSSLGRGKHTITAKIENSNSINAASNSYDVSVGYEITFMQYPTTWISNIATDVKIRVRDYFANLITNGNITFNSVTSTVGDNGIATLISSITSNGTYYAEYNGSTTPINAKVFSPSSITINPSSTITANGHSLSIPIHVDGDGDSKGLGVSVTHNDSTSKVLLNNSSNATYTYDGTGKGEKIILTASIGNTSQDIVLNDYGVYWTPSAKYNFNLIGQYSEQSNGLVLTFPPSGIITFNNSALYSTLEFDVVSVSGSGTHHYRMGDESYTKSVQLTKNNHIKVVWSNEGIVSYVDGEYVGTYTLEDGVNNENWIIKSNSTNSVRTLCITNIKIY